MLLKGKYVYNRRKFRSQSSDWKTDAATVVRAVKEKKEPAEKESVDSVDRRWRVRSHLVVWKYQNLHAAAARSTFRIKMLKNPRSRTTFGSWDVEKAQAPVVRAIFRSQNGQSLSGQEHFWALGRWKSARSCGAKHLSKSKCWKHTRFWRETRLQLKSVKNGRSQTTFGHWDVEKVRSVVAQSTFRS